MSGRREGEESFPREGKSTFFSCVIESTKANKMDIIIEQETSLNTIAALSTIAVMKTDNNQTAVSRQVQTDAVKGAPSSVLERTPTRGAFDNLPPCDPIDVYFKDLSYSVQKMFSKSEYDERGEINQQSLRRQISVQLN